MSRPESYRAAGVDIAAADTMLSQLAPKLQATYSPMVLTGLGGFGGALRLCSELDDPALVMSIDSVGTKVALAAHHDRLSSIGEDLVNHCANDILAMGALPLAFLDYIAHADLPPDKLAAAISGVAAACQTLGMPLIGGETAQLPGIYHRGQLDLVGAIVGLVDSARLIDGSRICAGDLVVALPSNGIHTNGYSLVRKVLGDFDHHVHRGELGRPLIDELLAVHRCYVSELSPHLERIRGLAHITGGGICQNTARIIPEGLCAQFGWGTWQVPPIFHLIQEAGNIPFGELAGVFNLGIGMVAIGDRELADELVRAISGSAIVGSVVPSSRPPRAQILR